MRKIITWVKSLFTAKLINDYRLVECYNKDGVKLYKFDNPLRIPTHRRLAMFSAINSAELGLTKEQLFNYCDMVRDYGTKGMVGEILAATSILEAYGKEDYTASILYATVSPLIMLEGENAEVNDAEYTKKKRDLFDHNDDVKAFFLSMGFVYLRSYSESSIGHIKVEDYLQNRQLKRTERMFLQLIQRNTDKALSVS